MEENGLVNLLRSVWKKPSRVMMICADPDDYEKNDLVLGCMKEAFPMSGLELAELCLCDAREEAAIAMLPQMDVVILKGGHVPTQNAFMKKVRLKEELERFDGLLIAWSAGSMNCAETVYAGPELPGEAIDPKYQRWISGLGLTKVNILPHFQALSDEMLDGMRVIEDITYADSYGHEFIALNDGSFLVIDDRGETLYGEAYRIKDGKQQQICRTDEYISLGMQR